MHIVHINFHHVLHPDIAIVCAPERIRPHHQYCIVWQIPIWYYSDRQTQNSRWTIEFQFWRYWYLYRQPARYNHFNGFICGKIDPVLVNRPDNIGQRHVIARAGSNRDRLILPHWFQQPRNQHTGLFLPGTTPLWGIFP